MRSLSTCLYALFILTYTQSASAFTLQQSGLTNQVTPNNTSTGPTNKTDTKPSTLPAAPPTNQPDSLPPSNKSSSSVLDIPVPPPSLIKPSPTPKSGDKANSLQIPPPPSVNKTSPLPTDPGKPELSATHGNCTVLPLTPDTWKQLKIDDYLKNYPGGKTLKLIDYATAKNASNFVCGIGEKCNIGQPCFPLGGVDWYVLFAVQAWNTYMNNFYLAVGYAMSMVQSSISALLASIFPAVDQSPAKAFKENFAINAGLTEVMGTVFMDVMVLFGAAMGPIGWAFTILNFMIATAMGITAFAIQVPSGPIQDGYGAWSSTAYFISKYEELAHDALAKAAQKFINAPISSDDGLYGTMKGGQFLSPTTLLTIPEIEDNIRNVTLALSLNMIFHSLNAFVTVGSNSCTDKGRNGAWPQNDVLSYCDKPGGTMYNIIRYLPGGKSGNNLPNANIISEEYGFSTELITQVSKKCQEKHGGFSFNPYTNGSFPKDVTSDCVFNLPVCFTDRPDIRHKIHKKHETTAKACRKTGGLPL